MHKVTKQFFSFSLSYSTTQWLIIRGNLVLLSTKWTKELKREKREKRIKFERPQFSFMSSVFYICSLSFCSPSLTPSLSSFDFSNIPSWKFILNTHAYVHTHTHLWHNKHFRFSFSMLLKISWRNIHNVKKAIKI